MASTASVRCRFSAPCVPNCSANAELDEEKKAQLVNLTQLLFNTIQTEVRQAGFWTAPPKQSRLKGELQAVLLGLEYYNFGPMLDKYAAIIARLMEWSRRNDKIIRRA